ncbi:MAG: hypothetical protein N2V78_08100 [Methanophagales archaeon]|nr:hypothetical protein [Methanophagales archaeon]
MEAKKLIVKEIEDVPEPYLIGILDFIRFLKIKDVGGIKDGIGNSK